MTAKTGGRRWTLVACAVLVAVAVGAIAYQGAPRFTGPRIVAPSAAAPAPSGVQRLVTATPGPDRVEPPSRLDLTWLAFVLTALAVIVVLALLWRLLRRRLRRPDLAPLPALEGAGVDAVFDEPAAPEPEAAPVRRGLDRALETLGEPRQPRDAIERAWLGLEEGAADSGVRRLPAETPAEFAARVVARVAADRGAADALLGLYLRARFSQAPLSTDDVEAARRAIRALQSSWGAASRGVAQ